MYLDCLTVLPPPDRHCCR